MSVYDFEVKDSEGNMISLKDFEGMVLLIINSATECGFTPQYTQLGEIYNEFRDDEFEILDFPCNQFGGQAPGSIEEIKEVCRNKWLVPYQIFDKIDVNGENADSLYVYLKGEKAFTGFTGEGASNLDSFLKTIDENYADNDDIKWNFTKFLVDREGNVVQRFEPIEDLDDVKECIKELL